MNLPNFWYGTSLNFHSFRGTNHTVSCYRIFFTPLIAHFEIIEPPTIILYCDQTVVLLNYILDTSKSDIPICVFDLSHQNAVNQNPMNFWTCLSAHFAMNVTDFDRARCFAIESSAYHLRERRLALSSTVNQPKFEFDFNSGQVGLLDGG